MKILISINAATGKIAPIKSLLSKTVRMSETEPKNVFTKAAELREEKIMDYRKQLVKDISTFLGTTKFKTLKEAVREYSKDFDSKDARIAKIRKDARTRFPGITVRDQKSKAKWLEETFSTDAKLRQLKTKAEKRIALAATLLPLEDSLLEALLFHLHLHYMFPASRALRD